MRRRDLVSTKGTCRATLEPCIDAFNMKTVVAFGKPSKLLTIHNLIKTHSTEWPALQFVTKLPIIEPKKLCSKRQ